MNIVRQSCMIESSVPDQNGQSLTDEVFLERNIYILSSNICLAVNFYTL